jgi:hypothetical protein
MKKRDLFWIGVFLLGPFLGAYLNEKYNLANPELEKKLVGCWAGSSKLGFSGSGESVLQINADRTFRETGIEKLAGKTRFVSASGSWKLLRNKLTLNYGESTAEELFPRARESLKLLVNEVTEDTFEARTDYTVSKPYEMSRVPTRDGACATQS